MPQPKGELFQEVAYRKAYSDGYLDKSFEPPALEGDDLRDKERMAFATDGWRDGQLDLANELPWGASHSYEPDIAAVQAADGSMVLLVEAAPKTAEFQYGWSGRDYYLRRNGVMVAVRQEADHG